MKPTKLKELNGTINVTRESKTNEPEPEVVKEVPNPPHYLPERARQEWKRTAPYLVAVGLLTYADLATFEDYCMLHHHIVQLNSEIEDMGYTMAMEGKSSHISSLRGMYKEKRALAKEMGMTPKARSKIDVPEKSEAGKTAEEILNGDASNN